MQRRSGRGLRRRAPGRADLSGSGDEATWPATPPGGWGPGRG